MPEDSRVERDFLLLGDYDTAHQGLSSPQDIHTPFAYCSHLMDLPSFTRAVWLYEIVFESR